MGTYEIDSEAIRRDVYRSFRKYIWFGLHFLVMMVVMVLDVSLTDADSPLTPITIILMLSWMMHFPYLGLLILRERAVRKAIERERKMFYQALQQRPAPPYSEAIMCLNDDGELIETIEDGFYSEKSKHLYEG